MSLHSINSLDSFDYFSFIHSLVSHESVFLRLTDFIMDSPQNTVLFVIYYHLVGKQKFGDHFYQTWESSHLLNKLIQLSPPQVPNLLISQISYVWQTHIRLCVRCLLQPCYPSYPSHWLALHPQIEQYCCHCVIKKYPDLHLSRVLLDNFPLKQVNNDNASRFKRFINNSKYCLLCYEVKYDQWPPEWLTFLPVLQFLCRNCAVSSFPDRITSSNQTKQSDCHNLQIVKKNNFLDVLRVPFGHQKLCLVASVNFIVTKEPTSNQDIVTELIQKQSLKCLCCSNQNDDQKQSKIKQVRKSNRLKTKSIKFKE